MSYSRKLRAKERAKELAVGLFFLLALGILAFFTIILNRDVLFQNGVTRQVVFESVAGIAPGDKVVLRGLEIGKVAEIVPTEDGTKILLNARLAETYTFHEGYLVEIRTMSALGGKQVYVQLGPPDAPVIPEDEVLIGRASPDVMNEVARMGRKIDEGVSEIMEIVAQVKSGDGTMHKLLYQDDMYTDVQEAFRSLNEAGEKVGGAMDELKKVGTEIDKAMADMKGLKEEFTKAADSVKTAGEELAKAGESVDGAASEIKAAVTDAREGKGTLGKLINDDALYEDARTAVADLRQAIERFKNEDSTMAKVMNDDGELYNSIKTGFDAVGTTMTDVQEMVVKVKEGQGTLGKLINDDSLYNETQETVKEVRGAVTDFREQAPILTFGSFVFGAL